MAPSSRVIAAEESTVSVLGTVYPFTAICVVLSWLLVASAFFLLARGARRRGERAVAVVSWIVAALAAVLAPIQFLYVGAGLVFNVVFFRFGSLAENSPYIDWAYVATVTLLCAALLRRGVAIPGTACELGYADQPHLTRSLKCWIGHTPAQLLGPEDGE